MESNAVDLDSYLVENSKVILENAMIEQWSAVRKESNYLNSVLSDLLKEQRADIEKFTKDKELQKEYTQRVFPELLESLRRDTTSKRGRSKICINVLFFFFMFYFQTSCLWHFSSYF